MWLDVLAGEYEGSGISSTPTTPPPSSNSLAGKRADYIIVDDLEQRELLRKRYGIVEDWRPCEDPHCCICHPVPVYDAYPGDNH